MHVVHIDDPWHLGQVRAHVGDIEVVGRRLHEDPQCVAQQAQRAGEDQGRHNQACHRIGALPAGQHDHRTGRDHSGRPQQVAQHLQVGPAHVDRLVLAGGQDPQRHEVRHHADDRDGEHDAGFHRLGVDQPLDGFDGHEGADPDEQQGVEGGGDHLQAHPPERSAVIRRALGCGRRYQREGHAEHVREDMAGIGKQRQ